jgi:hypothetical protein
MASTGGFGLAGSEMPVIVHDGESGWNHPDAIHGDEKKKKRFRNGPETVSSPCAKSIRRCVCDGACTMRVIPNSVGRVIWNPPEKPNESTGGPRGCAGSLVRFLMSLVHVEMGVRVEQRDGGLHQCLVSSTHMVPNGALESLEAGSFTLTPVHRERVMARYPYGACKDCPQINQSNGSCALVGGLIQ